MRRLTDHALRIAGISLLMLCPQAFATSTTCAYPHTPGMGGAEARSFTAQPAPVRFVPRDASRPAVAVPPEVLNLQLRPPASKP